MAKMTKAEMDAFKKKNFDLTKKVTKSQLDKLRAEKTPEKAIAKYKNDPTMTEALNRFYGKTRVGSVTVTPVKPVTGPGGKMPARPAGGPGAKGGSDGRKPMSSTKKPVGPSTGKAAAAAGGAVAVAAVAAKGMTKMDKKDVANAKQAAGRHAKTSGPKHAAPKTNPKAEVSKYVKKTTGKRAAAKQGVTNKMKAQGARIASSASSRYNQARRGK